MKSIPEILAEELGQKLEYVQNVVNLMDEGNTIPFIARYRKEMHGAMDDTTLRNLETRLTYLRNLQERRDEVKKSIENQGKLTQELSDAIDSAATMAEVEDLYRPYKQKRRTRGSIAREKGLAPLAEAIFAQDGQNPAVLAEGYIDPEKGVNSVEEALQGANDIIAEDLSDDADIRKSLRELVMRRGMLTCTAAEDAEADGVYKLYYDFSQPISRVLDHQILAMNRGEKEGVLKPNVILAGNEGAALVCRAALKPTMQVSAFVRAAAEDAYERLIFPSIQREVRSDLSDRAYAGAIRNFALNLKPLLMQPPCQGHRHAWVLTPDTATAARWPWWTQPARFWPPAGGLSHVSASGKRRRPLPPLSSRSCAKYRRSSASPSATEPLPVKRRPSTVELTEIAARMSAYMIVSEAGASVYSASQAGGGGIPRLRRESRAPPCPLPGGCRTRWPSWLKLIPRPSAWDSTSTTCPQKELDAALGGVVEDCVNAVGVDAEHRFPEPLLQQVSGLTATTAKNIVAYREENGPFTSRANSF